MAAQQLQCYTTEKQMDDALKLVQKELSKSDMSDISDIDETLSYNNNGHKTEFRVCVEFNIYLDKITIVSSEILDSDWDMIYEDTAVFTHHVRNLVKSINESNRCGIIQSKNIRKDQLQEIGL